MLIAHKVCFNCRSVLRPDREVCPVCHQPLTLEAEERFKSQGIEVDIHYGEKSGQEDQEKHNGKKTKKTIKKIKRIYRKRKG
jgi:predicted amidophosphoribosyltransferase